MSSSVQSTLNLAFHCYSAQHPSTYTGSDSDSSSGGRVTASKVAPERSSDSRRVQNPATVPDDSNLMDTLKSGSSAFGHITRQTSSNAHVFTLLVPSQAGPSHRQGPPKASEAAAKATIPKARHRRSLMRPCGGDHCALWYALRFWLD